MKGKKQLLKVSVLITTYNIESYIAETLDSVLMQKTDFSYEILVGDDGSSDGTKSVVESYLERYPDKIRLYVMPREEGINYNRVERSAANRQNLLEHAEGEYVSFLDGDDYYLSDCRLQKMVDILEATANKDCIMCAHNLSIVYDDDSVNFKPEIRSSGDIYQRDFQPLSRARVERKYTRRQYWKWMFLQSNGFLFRNIYRKYPPTENARRYFDDNNITYWLFQYGKLYYIPECLGAYRQVSGSSWNAIGHLQKAASNMIGYSVEVELNPKDRRISNIRHFPDYSYLFRHAKELNPKNCSPFYESAERYGLTEALRVYQMGQKSKMQYFYYLWRYISSMFGYGMARLERAVRKIAGRY